MWISPGAPERSEKRPTHDDIGRWRMTRYDALRPKPTPFLDSLGDDVLDEALVGLSNIGNRALIIEELVRRRPPVPRDGIN
jgi:hypothetical protein